MSWVKKRVNNSVSCLNIITVTFFCWLGSNKAQILCCCTKVKYVYFTWVFFFCNFLLLPTMLLPTMLITKIALLLTSYIGKTCLFCLYAKFLFKLFHLLFITVLISWSGMIWTLLLCSYLEGYYFSICLSTSAHSHRTMTDYCLYVVHWQLLKMIERLMQVSSGQTSLLYVLLYLC